MELDLDIPPTSSLSELFSEKELFDEDEVIEDNDDVSWDACDELDSYFSSFCFDLTFLTSFLPIDL